MENPNKYSGKYIGYLISIEGSALMWNDDIEVIKKQWCFGMAIFESNGLTNKKLKEVFPELPERGVLLEYLTENLPFVFQEGTIIDKIQPKREVIIEKLKKE